MWVFLHLSKIIELNVKLFLTDVHWEYFLFLRWQEIWICILYTWEMIPLVWPLEIALVSGLSLWKRYCMVDDRVIKTPRRNSITFQSLPMPLPCWQHHHSWLLPPPWSSFLTSMLTSSQNFHSSHFLPGLIFLNIPSTIFSYFRSEMKFFRPDTVWDNGTTCWCIKSC